MLVGHLAVALTARSVEPRFSLAAWIAAAFGLDLLWPLLLLAGAEHVRVDPGNTAFTHLAFESYPWSHSLLMSVVWAATAALVVRRSSAAPWRASGLIGVVVLSHWVLDFVTHRPDLPLWPGGPLAGLGLWHSVAGTIAVEGGLFLFSILMYLRVWRARGRAGHTLFGTLILVVTVVWITQPWSPPPPGGTALALGALVLWLLPPWAALAERHRTRA